MAEVQKITVDEKAFVLPTRGRNILLGTAALGLVLVLLGLLAGGAAWETRFWASLLLGNFYFFAISAVALFWVALQYVANAGWSASFKRLPEAMTAYLPIAFAVFLIFIVAGFIGSHGHGEDHTLRGNGIFALYEWAHSDIVEHDRVLSGKMGYLNLPFFIIRLLVYFVGLLVFRHFFRKFSLREDNELSIRNYNKSIRLGAGFIPFFALSFCFICYDWLMSLEPHWYSTIYAVNIFAGSLVTTCVTMIVILALLQREGYMKFINDSHIHDLGKFVFGFSIFWMYTWTAQYLLIWFANLPEEIPYYLFRQSPGWNTLFFANITINFFFPFLALMMRNAKRNVGYLMFVCTMLLIGRFIDFYLLVMPGTAKYASGFGFFEIGFFLLFLGLFGYTLAKRLSKAPMVPRNHPFLEESLHHNI